MIAPLACSITAREANASSIPSAWAILRLATSAIVIALATNRSCRANTARMRSSAARSRYTDSTTTPVRSQTPGMAATPRTWDTRSWSCSGTCASTASRVRCGQRGSCHRSSVTTGSSPAATSSEGPHNCPVVAGVIDRPTPVDANTCNRPAPRSGAGCPTLTAEPISPGTSRRTPARTPSSNAVNGVATTSAGRMSSSDPTTQARPPLSQATRGDGGDDISTRTNHRISRTMPPNPRLTGPPAMAGPSSVAQQHAVS
jgi:hypothetical protein